MTKEKFSYALGNIGENYINEANAFSAKKKKINPFLKWSSIAACFTLILAATLIFSLNIFGDRDNGLMYYDYRVTDGTFSMFIGGNVIDVEKIGAKLESVDVTTGWKNKKGKWLDNKVLKAEIYEIKGVNSSVAAALRFIDEDDTVSNEDYYVIMHPNAQYNGMLFPDYKAENPVRYLGEDIMGKNNGWQDFGVNGEIRTITVPVGSTVIYQMYSYYIRNDLTHIYSEKELPKKLEDLPIWLTDTLSVGRKSFWYSMGGRLPSNITLESTDTVVSENGAIQFLRAEYTIGLSDDSGSKEEKWVVYFMEENGVYSAFAVEVNQNYDFVKSYTETIVRSYQNKQ